MRYFRLYALLVIICAMSLLAAAPGCVKVKLPEQKDVSAAVSDAALANAVDNAGKPINPSTAFLVNAEVIYLSVRLNNAPANTQVLVKLNYIRGEASNLAGTTMYNNTQTGQGSGYLAFAMKPPPGGFPQGDYSVSVNANGKEITTTSFKVENMAAQKGWPSITTFKVSPDTVPQGQPVTLTWDVSNATRITLQPEVGTIPALGTRSLTPSVTTTYQIVASNDAGATKREVTVNVTAPLAGAPDLIVTTAWLEGCTIYYKVKNIGAVESSPTYTHLWVDGLFPPLGGSSYVDVLKPGQERSLQFSSFQWPWCGAQAGSGGDGSLAALVSSVLASWVDPGQLNHTVKVCSDAKDEVKEGVETNNCLSKIWGILFQYDLPPVAHLATWKNSSGETPQPGVESASTGTYIKLSDGGLEMVPDQVPQGWLQGYWGFFYTERETRAARTAYIKIPAKTKFISRVGLAYNADGSDGVTFKFGLRDLSDQTNFFPGKTMKTPGIFENYEVDLSDYVDQKVIFILRVEAIGTPTNDYAVWKEARLVQSE